MSGRDWSSSIKQLDLAAEHAAFAVDFLGAEDHALGRRLGIRLGNADAIRDHADLDGLPAQSKPPQKRQRERRQ
jgi:hypothetical protein